MYFPCVNPDLSVIFHICGCSTFYSSIARTRTEAERPRICYNPFCIRCIHIWKRLVQRSPFAYPQLSYLPSRSKNAFVLHQLGWNTMLWQIYFNGDTSWNVQTIKNILFDRKRVPQYNRAQEYKTTKDDAKVCHVNLDRVPLTWKQVGRGTWVCQLNFFSSLLSWQKVFFWFISWTVLLTLSGVCLCVYSCDSQKKKNGQICLLNKLAKLGNAEMQI